MCIAADIYFLSRSACVANVNLPQYTHPISEYRGHVYRTKRVGLATTVDASSSHKADVVSAMPEKYYVRSVVYCRVIVLVHGFIVIIMQLLILTIMELHRMR